MGAIIGLAVVTSYNRLLKSFDVENEHDTFTGPCFGNLMVSGMIENERFTFGVDAWTIFCIQGTVPISHNRKMVPE
jgi:hypothetical protein